jgi:predicted secreted hydrolase
MRCIRLTLTSAHRSRRAAWIVRLAALLLTCGARALSAGSATEPPPETAAPAAAVVAGHALEFPRDYGSHPQFGVEWWYVTGWLQTREHERLGFQITFFRTRQQPADPNPSSFAPRQLLIAHCAISDPRRGHPWQDQRVRRAGLGLAEARSGDTSVWIDDWKLERDGAAYQADVSAVDFALHLRLAVTQPTLLNGAAGYSQKGPSPQSASFYYSQPHLQVSGSIERAARRDVIAGEAWLDHEWSSQYLDSAADGWDWVGLNLDDGSALMAFRIRGHEGQSYWAGGTLRDAHGQLQDFGPDDVTFIPGRRWRSPRTGVSYPVTWQLRVGSRQFAIEPLLDDQENDMRLSSGAVYWEGAVRVQEQARAVGAGYLELTGYQHPLSLR